LWTNNGTSVTDLHPASGYFQTAVYALSGNTQVGIGDVSDGSGGHALLWHGSAGSVVNLNGSSFESEAHGAFEDHQVGIASNHAALWSGSADSLVDLNPAGYTQSFALGIWGDRQVGWADIHTGFPTDTLPHAVLWNSTADSAVFLNDGGFDSTYANAINAEGDVVGYGTIDKSNQRHALLWTDPTDPSVAPIDLSLLLPPELGNFSVASGIDADGTIVGTGGPHAIVWQPTAAAAVPLPTAVYPGALLLVLGMAQATRRAARV
jgi:probable HAF family extracellular repeat protein